MIKITVPGAAGRMGKTIIEKILADPDLLLTGAVEFKGHMSVGDPVGKIEITDDLTSAAKESDVVIDFTSPETTLYHLEVMQKIKKAFVIGTTGIPEVGIEKIKVVSKEIPIVFAPNMSIGVNLLFKLVGDIANVLSNYDIEIIEAHHNQKKDAPSGTALKIAEILSKKLKLSQIYGRSGNVGARKKEIGIHSVRAGDIIGDHTVIFAGPGERIEITHRAHSRETFAAGAIKAAKWIVDKKPGLYTMQDVLGL
ncbi:MAG: 4-hydroxy-tetrahydrodipicolinate reductase [Elusimicrobia bacterium RIFOXYD2_FULL_34_15]|nr:MAG: 4-hydroxy-tetrahydrodipicolinate reductase [Elusimicrobia bacterium RIFOXYD2_FULL_34_15]